MSRFCSNLGLPKQVQMAATFIARKAVELDLVPGRSPISVAAAAIYMASQASAEKKTQKGENFGCHTCADTFANLKITKATTVLAGDWPSDLIVEHDAMLPQKSGTSRALQTSPSDSRIVSSTHGLQNSSLRTSSSTRPLTSCRCCEDLVHR